MKKNQCATKRGGTTEKKKRKNKMIKKKNYGNEGHDDGVCPETVQGSFYGIALLYLENELFMSLYRRQNSGLIKWKALASLCGC